MAQYHFPGVAGKKKSRLSAEGLRRGVRKWSQTCM